MIALNKCIVLFFSYVQQQEGILYGHASLWASAKHIELRVNDRKIASPTEVANVFNTYFSSIGNDLTKSIPIVEKTPREYLHNPVCDSFFNYLPNNYG